MLLQWTSYCFLVTYMPRDTCMPRVLSLPCNFVSYELNVVFEKFQWLFGCTKCGKAFVVCHVCQNCPGTRAALMTRVLDMWLYIFWTKCWFQKIPMAIWVYKVWKRFCSMPCLSELSRYTCSTVQHWIFRSAENILKSLFNFMGGKLCLFFPISSLLFLWMRVLIAPPKKVLKCSHFFKPPLFKEACQNKTKIITYLAKW